MGGKGSKADYKKVAEERILFLFAQIGNTKDKEFGKNCAKVIRSICLKYNIRLKKDQKSHFCKYCFSCFNLENPKIRIKSIKKGNKKAIQKKYICPCGKETTITYNKK